MARRNATRLGLDIRLSQGNWLDGSSERYHLIVANPPYVADADPHLPALAHEPLQALTAGAEGLDDLRAIIASAPVPPSTPRGLHWLQVWVVTKRPSSGPAVPRRLLRRFSDTWPSRPSTEPKFGFQPLNTLVSWSPRNVSFPVRFVCCRFPKPGCSNSTC